MCGILYFINKFKEKIKLSSTMYYSLVVAYIYNIYNYNTSYIHCISLCLC